MNLTATKKSIQRGGSILQQGGLVAFPTETVYGLGADASLPTDAHTGYMISQDSAGKITVSAPHAELEKPIEVTR